MRLRILILSLLSMAFGNVAAHAHAFLDHASPLVGSTVTGPNGARVDAGKPQISGNTMHVGLKAAGPGTYHVRWHALSVDTHKTEGSFTFSVGGR